MLGFKECITTGILVRFFSLSFFVFTFYLERKYILASFSTTIMILYCGLVYISGVYGGIYFGKLKNQEDVL